MYKINVEFILNLTYGVINVKDKDIFFNTT